MRRWSFALALLLASLGVAAQSVQPAQPAQSTQPTQPAAAVVESETLAKIRTLGAVFLGYRESSAPFSYYLDGKGAGYSMDICERVVDAIKTRLGKTDIKTVHVPLPGSLRFTMVIDGIADMECGVSTNTKVRQQRMAFSVTFFESKAKFLVNKDSSLAAIKDLDGKTVVVGAATTAGRTIATTAKRHNIIVKVVSARDRADALDMVAAGKADAYLGDDALLLGALLTRKDRDHFRLMDDPVTAEPYGLVLRRDDPEFKKLVDEVLTGLMKSGEMAKIYDKWFMAPVPPSGNSLNMPLSPRQQLLFEAPSDAGI